MSWGRHQASPCWPVWLESGCSDATTLGRWTHGQSGQSGLNETAGSRVLAHGLGRSYGDCALNDGGLLLKTRRMNRYLSFDESTGELSCEAGVSLAEVLRDFGPRGWFLPTTPGTRFVTVGGAIANDVHGKNHERAGTFGCHVRSLVVLRSDGSRVVCTPTENTELYRATIGGMGLTGLITRASFQLVPIGRPWIDHEVIPFRSLQDFMHLSIQSREGYEHVVSWIDCSASSRNLGRGLLFRGNYSGQPQKMKVPRKIQGLRVPVTAPEWLLSPLLVRGFNSLYFHQAAWRRRQFVPLENFFYPLDSLRDWNLLYGRKGFFQWQCVLPESAGTEPLQEVLARIGKAQAATPLAVLKVFGKRHSPGLMSFPMPGITLALDIRNRGQSTIRFLHDLDRLVVAAGGRMYPAKDACMTQETFRAGFPQWESFCHFMDPYFSSNFARRVGLLR